MLTTRAHLRRALLAQQGLLGERAPGGASGAVAWVRRQGFLPLEVKAHALAPSHDIALFNRVSGYLMSGLDVALYDDGQFFEHYLYVLGALPAQDLGLVLDPERTAAAAAPGSPAALVLEFLRSEGPASAREVQAFLRRRGQGERRTVARALHTLFTGGAILVRRREGSQEIFDLAERVLPRASREVLPTEERLEALARRTLRALAPVTRQGWSQVLNAVGSRTRLDLAAMKREKSRLIADMLATGEAVSLAVEDPPQAYIVPADWLPALEQQPYVRGPRVIFLSPVDPVVWDRQRARDLFGYDWREDAYPGSPERRRFGAWSLPILYGQALVGRLEPQMSWSSRRLLVHRVHLADQSLVEDQHFRTTFATALWELAAFHDAHDVRATGPLPPRLQL